MPSDAKTISKGLKKEESNFSKQGSMQQFKSSNCFWIVDKIKITKALMDLELLDLVWENKMNTINKGEEINQ